MHLTFMRKIPAYVVMPAAMAMCFVPVLLGQQPMRTNSQSAGTHSVVIPVTVRDKKGSLVTDLPRSALTLTEDGRPQTIQSLEKAANTPLRVGILVDTSKSMAGVIEAERKAVADFVDMVLPSADTRNQAFLIHFDREVELLEDFTSSRDKLRDEVEGMGPTKQERYEVGGPETTGDDRERPRRSKGKQFYDALFLACDELMKGKDGRKVLVIFSDGADRGSKDTLNDAVDSADHDGVSVYTIFMKGAGERENGGFEDGGGRRHGSGWPGGGGGYPGGGGGYPGGGSGRREPEPRAGNGADGRKVMQQVATRTGGHAYEAKKRDDLASIYGLIQQELQGQWLLSYAPDKSDNGGGYHKIAVTASDKDMSVSAPEGYYAQEGK